VEDQALLLEILGRRDQLTLSIVAMCLNTFAEKEPIDSPDSPDAPTDENMVVIRDYLEFLSVLFGKSVPQHEYNPFSRTEQVTPRCGSKKLADLSPIQQKTFRRTFFGTILPKCAKGLTEKALSDARTALARLNEEMDTDVFILPLPEDVSGFITLAIMDRVAQQMFVHTMRLIPISDS